MTHHGRELEADSSGIDGSGDGEGTNRTGSQLTGVNFERRIIGGEPDPLS